MRLRSGFVEWLQLFRKDPTSPGICWTQDPPLPKYPIWITTIPVKSFCYDNRFLMTYLVTMILSRANKYSVESLLLKQFPYRNTLQRNQLNGNVKITINIIAVLHRVIKPSEYFVNDLWIKRSQTASLQHKNHMEIFSPKIFKCRCSCTI